MNTVSRKRNIFHSVLVSALAVLSLSAPAAGHKTFLSSEHVIWAEGTAPVFALTSALEFPDQETGLATDRISFISGAIGHQAVTEIGYTETETALNIRLESDADGLGVLAISTHPRSGEIPPESVGLYFEEIGASEDVRAAFRALDGSPPLMRSYSKHTKIIFCVATCEDVSLNAATPQGQALEFVMLSRSERLFALVHEGDRAANHQVTIHTADGEALVTQTNDDGSFEVSGEVNGDILMSAVWLALPEAPDGNYHSEQATLTLRID